MGKVPGKMPTLVCSSFPFIAKILLILTILNNKTILKCLFSNFQKLLAAPSIICFHFFQMSNKQAPTAFALLCILRWPKHPTAQHIWRKMKQTCWRKLVKSWQKIFESLTCPRLEITLFGKGYLIQEDYADELRGVGLIGYTTNCGKLQRQELITGIWPSQLVIIYFIFTLLKCTEKYNHWFITYFYEIHLSYFLLCLH